MNIYMWFTDVEELCTILSELNDSMEWGKKTSTFALWEKIWVSGGRGFCYKWRKTEEKLRKWLNMWNKLLRLQINECPSWRFAVKFLSLSYLNKLTVNLVDDDVLIILWSCMYMMNFIMLWYYDDEAIM